MSAAAGEPLHAIREAIRAIPDYPKPGVTFRDITPLIGNARLFREVVDRLVEPWRAVRVDRVAGIEARGFILGGAVAHELAAGFVPIRKKGKLPHTTVRAAYSLEYGLDEIEMHRDALSAGESIVLVDDLLATGGTAEAAVKLLRLLGARLLGASFIVDLPDLGGSERLRALAVPVRTLVAFSGR
jgi:adenine phosphoribosyltransferase